MSCTLSVFVYCSFLVKHEWSMLTTMNHLKYMLLKSYMIKNLHSYLSDKATNSHAFSVRLMQTTRFSRSDKASNSHLLTQSKAPSVKTVIVGYWKNRYGKQICPLESIKCFNLQHVFVALSSIANHRHVC